MKNNSRKITDSLPHKIKKLFFNRAIALNLRFFLFLVLTIQIGLFLYILVFLERNYVLRRNQYAENVKNYQYWKSAAQKFPNVPDILFNAAKSAAEIGERKQALSYLDKALRSDPLFSKAQKLRLEVERE